MNFRRFFAACAALLLGVAVVDTAEAAAAYPVTARIGAATVTGVYRPLDLTFTLVDGTDALFWDSGTSEFGFTATYSAKYVTSVGSSYTAAGDAGSWQLEFFSTSGTASLDQTTITVSPDLASRRVGTLKYLGASLAYPADYTGVSTDDTPVFEDGFDLYAQGTGAFLQVVCVDGVATCQNFTMTLLEDLLHLGPITNLYEGLDPIRSSPGCSETITTSTPCGNVPKENFSVRGVPEPASLALVGVGLAALALGRRRRKSVAVPV